MIFTQEQLEKYADVLLWGLKTARTGSYKKGDIVLVQSDLAAISLAEALQPKLLDMGMNVVVRIGGTPKMERNFYERTNRRQLVFVAPGERELYGSLNGRIFLHAPESLTHLQDIDPKKIGKVLIARKLAGPDREEGRERPLRVDALPLPDGGTSPEGGTLP